jgi:hypothetical protein
MDEAANHILLPWVLPGMAAHLPGSAVETLSASQAAVLSLPVHLEVNGAPLDRRARVYGPGDVTGIDPEQILRVEPRDLTPDFEPNYFPLIEFDRPEFPWLFTPATADAQGRLRPWLCLVVVREQPGVTLRPSTRQPLPVLEIRPPARPGDELPDLAESHLWAHAQVTGASRAALGTALASQPERTLSRLVCPRRLRPSTPYLACVVPAFEVGRRAGLGLPVEDNATLAPAWASGVTAPGDLDLPVYHAWRFRTGVGGDFEELVRRLQPRELPPAVGKRGIDVSEPGFDVSAPAPVVLGLEGALRAVGSTPDEWTDAARVPFQTALRPLLNLSWELAAGSTDSDPVLGPPIYGCWHAGVHTVPQGSAPPPAWPPPFWLDALNLDPRHRAVAALGTAVVQTQQEALMASAWAQLGDIQKINQRLRQAQLSRAVNARYHAAVFARLSPDAFFRIVAPARARLAAEAGGATGEAAGEATVRTVLAQRLRHSFVPAAALSPASRMLARPRGPFNRHYVKEGQAGAVTLFTVFAGGGIVLQQAGPASAAVTVDAVSQASADALAQRPGFIWNPEPPPHWERVRAGYTEALAAFRLARLGGSTLAARATPPNTPAGLRDAIVAHHEMLTGLFAGPVLADLRRPLVAMQMKAATMTALAPATAVARVVRAAVEIGSPPLRTADDLAPIMDAPVFPQPMYEGLREVSPDAIFPGLEHVPPNTVQLLETNAAFIEAYMVGLNVEMGRELLWRDYPTDQRGSYFRQFWDTAAPGLRPDIDPIHQWGTRPLGATSRGNQLVLLVRGELLRRYPGTVIYAVPAVVKDGRRQPSIDPASAAYPVFRGSLDPDVTFVGFDLTAADAVAGDGWFLVFQQQPSEPRFGLDDDPFGEGESGVVPPLRTWNDLNWAHVAADPVALAALTHLPVASLDLVPSAPVKGTWGRNAAHMAYITKQRLVRVAIHATEMLP